MVDRILVMRKLADLELYLDQIREFSGVTRKTYASDWKSQRAVERTLQIMIEVCVDIAAHLISEKRLRVPVSYADTFKVLFEAGVIGRPLFQIMEKMAKFRNVVVHSYDKVDQAIVLTILKKHLNDFLTYRDAVVASLSS